MSGGSALTHGDHIQTRPKVDNLGNCSRRNDLIMNGVEGSLHEKHNQLEESVVCDIFSEKIGVNTKRVERIHSLGQASTGKQRLVNAKFNDYNEGMAIFTVRIRRTVQVSPLEKTFQRMFTRLEKSIGIVARHREETVLR